MKNFIYWINSILISIFWPLSFFFANQDSWTTFFLALGILILDYFLYSIRVKYHHFLYLLLPVIHPAFLAFPIFYLLYLVISSRGLSWWKNFSLISFTLLVITVSIFSSKAFFAHSIFTPDPLAFDTLSRKISLIPNRNLARVFENKTTIFQDKFKSNIFVSFDLNNYFFSLHPQEIGGNQNINKFPYLALIPFLIGIYYILEYKHRVWLVATLLVSITSIAFINNQDRFDFIVYLPIVLICLYGHRLLLDKLSKYFWFFSAIFVPASIIELIRIVITN